VAELRVAGVFKESADISHALNQLVRLPELQETVHRLAREMDEGGIKIDMLGEATDETGSGVDPEDEDLAVRLVYNEIAREANRNGRQPVALLPVDPSEVEADPRAAAISRG
jgi:hypothetical protein